MPSHSTKRKRRVMRKFKIGEISTVDRPAQSGALSLIMKRDDGRQGTIHKSFENAIMTLPDNTGHSHLLPIDGRVGETTWSRGTDGEGHDHPFIVNPDGTITIGEMLGHGHEVESLEVVAMLTTLAAARVMEDDVGVAAMITMKQHSVASRTQFIEKGVSLPDGSFIIQNATDLEIALKALGHADDEPVIAQHIASRADALALNKEFEILKSTIVKNAAENGGVQLGTIMIDTTTAATKAAEEEVQKKLDTATAKLDTSKAALAKAESIATMNDAQTAHYKGLDKDAQAEYLAKSFDDRQKVLVSKASENAVVFTANDGTEYRKNDDTRLVSLAKKADEDSKALRKSLQDQADMELQKRAETDLASLPGDVATHVAILKAIDAIEDETIRTAALDTLKAQNTKMSDAFKVVGSTIVSKAAEGDANAEMHERAVAYAKEHQVEYYEAYDVIGKQDPALLEKAVGS